jgi:hypothetical protein
MVKTPQKNFSQIAVEAEKIERDADALLFAKKEGDIRDQRRKLIQDQLRTILTAKYLTLK